MTTGPPLPAPRRGSASRRQRRQSWELPRRFPGGGRWSSHLVQVDGGRSTTIEEIPSVDGAWGFTVAPDGGIWRGSPSGAGLERFDGRRWATVIDDVQIFGPIAVAPDGAVYFGGPSGLQRYVPQTEP